MRLLLCLAATFAVVLSADVGRKCKKGEKGEPEGIRYYIDEERNAVYPFFYQGCGGTAGNRFKTRGEATGGLHLDGLQCTGWVKSEGECNIHGPIGAPDGCPKGTRCMMGNHFGICCSEKAEARYNENQKAKCKSAKGAQKYMDTDWNVEKVEFGKSCTHNFCKKGATCVQGEFEAYCCL